MSDSSVASATDQDTIMALAAPELCSRTDGACEHEVAGVELVACHSGVVSWPAEAALIVADLHLEKGSSFARKGMMLPPYDTFETLKRLERAVGYWRPKRLIALGDSFHDGDAPGRLPLPAKRHLEAIMRGLDWVWITGNHDPDPPHGLAGEVMDELMSGSLTFRHEPLADAQPGEIAGHLHPKARLVRRGRHIRRSCFAASASRMVLPSFGAYTGGLNVLDRAFKRLFDGRDFHALMRGDAQVFKIAGRDLA